MPNKTKKIDWRKIAKTNPDVDPNILRQSIEFVDYIRKVGAKGKGFNILRSSEARLKVHPPTLHQL